MVRRAVLLLLVAAVSAEAQPLSPTSAPDLAPLALSGTAHPVSLPAGTLGPSGHALSGTALSLSPPADVLAAMAPRPSPPPHTANARWEDFTAVTLLSAPFTAIWSVLGAVLVATVSQSRGQGKLVFPNMGTPELTGAALVAATASVSIGLISVQWGATPPMVSPTARSLPAPLSTTPIKAVP
jgi:hypothetical protein